jgi:hypothetical protein
MAQTKSETSENTFQRALCKLLATVFDVRMKERRGSSPSP